MLAEIHYGVDLLQSKGHVRGFGFIYIYLINFLIVLTFFTVVFFFTNIHFFFLSQLLETDMKKTRKIKRTCLFAVQHEHLCLSLSPSISISCLWSSSPKGVFLGRCYQWRGEPSPCFTPFWPFSHATLLSSSLGRSLTSIKALSPEDINVFWLNIMPPKSSEYNTLKLGT